MEIEVVSPIEAEAEVQRYTLVSDDKRVGCIYAYRNTYNGKYYVGQTVQPIHIRKYQHTQNAKKGSTQVFHKALRKYGVDAFEFSIVVDNVPVKLLDDLEISIIYMYDAFTKGYNATEGGFGRRGAITPEEVKEKIRQGNLGKKHTEGSIQLMRKIHAGKIITAETRRKMADGKRGVKYTGTAKENIGKALRNNDQEYRKKKAKEASAKPVICVETGITYPSIMDASRAISGGKSIYPGIHQVCNGTRNTAGGFTWRFAND